MRLPRSTLLALSTFVILTASVSVTGCGSSESYVFTSSPGSSVVTSATTEQLFGTVHVSRMAPHTTVEVLPIDSDTPLTSFSTNAAGGFFIPRGTQLPEQFRLSAMTPEGVRVERFVEAGPRPHLFMNLVSTIVSRYKLTHPELTLAQIESKVQQGLLGGSPAMYGTNDTESSPFSPARFLAASQAAGGVDPLVQSLVEGLESGRTFDFRGGNTKGTFLALYQTSQNVLADLNPLSSVGFWLLGETAGKVFDETSYRLTGKVNGALGTAFGDAASFQEVFNELNEIESTISTFDNEMINTYLQSNVNRIENKLGDDVTNITNAIQATIDTAQKAQSEYASNPDVDNHGPSIPPSDLTTSVKALDFLTSGTALQHFHTAFTSADPTDNLFLAANQAASGSGTASANNSPPAANSAPSGSINHTSSANYDYYDLRNDIITKTLVSNANSSLGYLTQLAVLLSEAANISVLPTPLDQTPGFAPPAYALNEGVEYITNLYAQDAYTASSIIAQPVGTDLVLIDCQNRLMWYLGTNLCKYDVAQNGMIGLNLNGWGYPAGVSPPAQVGSSVTKDLVNFKRPSDMTGWRVPEVSELEILQGQIVSAGGGTVNDNAIVEGLQNLGFTGLSDLNDHSNFRKFWYNGAVVQTQQDEENNIYAKFNYFDMEQNKTVLGQQATFFDPREDPLYTAVYVRTLNFTDSNYFGDTTQQIYKSYGQAPTSLTMSRTVVGDATQATILDYSSVSGYYASIMDHTTAFNQLQDWMVWSVELPSPNNNPPDLEASDIAYVTFVSSGFTTPGGTSNVRLVFKRPGTVVLRGTVRDPGNPNPTSITVTETSAVYPRLTAIGITPQNVEFQAIPTSAQSERYYCTGYLANGLTVDLTGLVKWDVVTAYGSNAQPPWTIDNTPPYQGLLQFGDPSTLLGTNTLRATYTSGSDANQLFSDGGQDFTDESSFDVPVR